MEKLVPLLVYLFFGIPFSVIGINAWIQPAGSTAYAWMQTRNWQPTQAEVLSTELKSPRTRGDPIYRVEAEYLYQLNPKGPSYRSSRIGLATLGADSVGDWHQTIYDRLSHAKHNQRPITVWVNQDNPAEAIYDRTIRWQFILFSMPFAIVFTFVGFVALGMGWLIIFNPQSQYLPKSSRQAFQRKKNSLFTKPPSNDNSVPSEDKPALLTQWCMALLWVCAVMPFPFLLFQRGKMPAVPAITILLILALIGYWLFEAAIKGAINWRRYGNLRLQLQPFPARLGTKLLVSAILPKPEMANRLFNIELICRLETQHGKYSSQETLWQKNLNATSRTSMGKTTLAFDVTPHDKQPASQALGGQRIEWLIKIQCHEKGAELNRSFVIPVFQ
jgi:Protein of unknown function (DUF3592)